jgi:alginate O-acetyltransferase complex protein AlgI
LFIVFFLCGLWHGANWTFVIWGMYHGLFLVAERAGLASLLSRIGREFRHVYTLLVVVVGWVLFRSETVAAALSQLEAMIGRGAGDGIRYHVWLYLQPDVALALMAGALASTPYVSRLDRASRAPMRSGETPCRTAPSRPACCRPWPDG